ncbi:response regulator transcription factor [Novosphingobium sp. ERN07]|uniref:response regulator transcription factor n=1 Tax=Novosphingobium sp. ERN07 TaxID=2726187 RepID=UPI0014566CAC|nr:response regulator transcription factor [Novosphingobium sp. ERN07]
MEKFRILAIDDHHLFLSGLELIVRQSFPFVEFISKPGLGAAIDALHQTPDLVMLDFNLVGVSGEAALALVRMHWPKAKIFIITSEDTRWVTDCLGDAEGVSILSKAEPPTVLIDRIAKALPVASSVATAEDQGKTLRRLTARQIEILGFVREGHSNKAIARLIGLSEFTVRGHVQQIFKLLNATNRTNAVYLAEQARLI